MNNILITGASSGIGLQTFLKAIQQSIHPIAAVRDPEKFISRVSAITNISKNQFQTIKLDLRDDNSVETFAQRLKQQSNSIDHLVLNAGFIKTSPALMTTSDSIIDHLKVNYVSNIAIAQSIVKSYYLRKKKGSIVAISSSAAIDANSGRLAYAASKAAFSTAIRVMSRELGRVNIRCNVIAPGLTDTDLMRNSTDDDQIDIFAQTLSLGRVGTPTEIADVILYLCSDNASYITGQVISVDGGI